jgi:hypothetical protein
MVSLRKSVVAAAGLAPLVAALSLATPSPTGAQQGGETPRPQNVTVVNTPLPVTGAVDVLTVPPLSMTPPRTIVRATIAHGQPYVNNTGRRVVIEAISTFTLGWNASVSIPKAGVYYMLPVTRDHFGHGAAHVQTRIYLEPGDELHTTDAGDRQTWISGYVENP